LACAASIDQERLRSVAVLVGLAPSNAEELDWFDGMTDDNVDKYELASFPDSDAVAVDLTQRAEEIRRDPESLLSVLEKEMTGADLRIVTDVAIRRQLAGTYKEAVKDGAYGWIDDVLAFRRPWGFDLEKISVPVMLWHGEDDVFSPADHTRWLARHIRTAQVEVERGAAHFGALEILPRFLARMKVESTAPPTAAWPGQNG
jgi:pimeloyl-ACP methyl ester carboxylesterase